MTKEQKNQFVDDLTVTLSSAAVIYLADTSQLNSETTSALRRACYKKDVKMSVVKNTLLKKAFERVEGKDFSELYGVLAGPTSLLISDTGNVPAKLIKEFRKKNERPILKAAFVEEMCYIGDDQLTALTEIKSREELIGDIIMLLQSPIKNVVGALQSGGHTIAGLVKTLSER
ncbi:50S ribosomal protein L10 [Cryomorpha ignava]|uniref:Large ribosomal subunit protein uL10 n=1 Tax=Cryomorpha ignava TaxID=101383 RepID=A0A7K3WMG5_9FLAO|nr:50S ribosomal protein L10 [Cryomorpha ignava]NEN22836.1 50S ribosomal protein L10 [Cryomorpha ignava]